MICLTIEREILERLRQTILSYDTGEAVIAAQEVIKSNVNFHEALGVITKTLKELGEKFNRGEIYLPHLVMAADAAEGATKALQVIMPKGEKLGCGKVVIGTIQGDIHDIGKNIVTAILRSAGFEVYDLGKDVPIKKFIEKAEELGADIIASSALMTVSMPNQKLLEEELKHFGLKEKYKTIVGGGPITQDWADKIGANGFGRTALDAVKKAKKLLDIAEE